MKNIKLFEEFFDNSLTEAVMDLKSERFSWLGDLMNKLKPYGFQEAPNKFNSSSFNLHKGNDYDGIDIFVNRETGDVEWKVFVGKQFKVNKKFKINYNDIPNIGKQSTQVYDMIMKDITPYLKMQIRPGQNLG